LNGGRLSYLSSLFFYQHKLPSIDAEEKDCIADFTLRKKIRLDSPGACSLNYQSAIQIVEQILLGWDAKTQTGSPDGILDEIVAFSRADEEQARKTLHGHLLVWIKGFADKRHALFDDDAGIREAARAEFYEYIDRVMSSSYRGDADWVVEHECNGKTKKEKVEDIFQECVPQILRDARHKEHCHEVGGKILECKSCGKGVSTQEIINMTLREWHQNALRDKQTSANSNLEFPLSKARLDIAAYRWPYDKYNSDSKLSEDKFWGDDNVRRILQISADNEHRAAHGPRCFKKGNECTSGSFPQAHCPDTCIHEDKSGGQEELRERYLLNGDITHSPPWMILTKRPLGCQYLNTHNPIISGLFSSNSNVLMGDISQAFYTTLYSSKSTQQEDRDKYTTIGKKLIRRMNRLELEREANPDEHEEDENGQFVNGLSMVLSAMIANTSRDVVSTPMSHLLVAQKGKRFTFSHEPKNLLVTQLETQLDNDDNEVQFTLRRTNRSSEEGNVIQWPDSSANDYLHRPVELDDYCAYSYTEIFEKKFFSWKEMDNDEEDTAVSKSRGYRFPTEHPGHEFAYMHPLKVPAVVVVSYPEEKVCLLKELELTSDNPSQLAKEKRENYAMVALMMFYPFRTLDDLLLNDSYWTTFDRELKGYFNNMKTVFWAEGFKILQNIEDRMSMHENSSRVRTRDPVQLRSVVKSNDKEKKKKNEDDHIPDISRYVDSDEESYDESDIEDGEGYGDRKCRTHDHLVNRVQLRKGSLNDRCIAARLASMDRTLIQSTDDEHTSNNAQGGDDGRSNSREDEVHGYSNKDYPTLIKLITGSLIGGSTSYDDIYEDDEDIIQIDNSDESMEKVAEHGIDANDEVPTVTQDDGMQNEQVSYIQIYFVTKPYSHLCIYNQITGNECPDIGRRCP